MSTPGATNIDLSTLLPAAAVAAAGTFFLTPLVRRLAIHVGAVDDAGGRRVHSGQVPRLGGLAVLAACLLAVAALALTGSDVVAKLREAGWSPGWLLIGTLLVTAVGAVDDIQSLGPFAKLAVQTIAGGVALGGGYSFHAVTNPLAGGFIDLGAIGPILTVLWVVGITNAFNLIDGLDGLAAGVGVITCATLAVLSIGEGRNDAALVAMIVGGAMAGFLPHNFPPAKIFLGDSGALLLGYLLSIVSMQSLQKGVTSVVVLAPVLALGLPIMETAVTVLRRWFTAGAATIVHADQNHLHHRLLARGMSHRRAVLVLYCACVAFGVVAYLSVLVRDQGKLYALIVGGVAASIFFAVRALYALPIRGAGTFPTPHQNETDALRAATESAMKRGGK